MSAAQRLAAWIARVEYAATFLTEGKPDLAETVLRRGLTEVGAR